MDNLTDSQALPSVQTQSRRRGRRYDQLVLFNFLIPCLLLGLGVFVIIRLGTVQPEKRPDLDTTRTGRLKSLPPVRVVELQSLAATGQTLRLQVDGTVVPYRESRVAAEVAGRIVFKSDQCEAGSYVTEGQLLMRIDPTDHELEVQRLTRLKEQEYQALNEIDQEMVNTKRVIDVAKEDMQLQQREFERQKSMPKGFASRAEIDQANRALLAAQQQLVNSENLLELLRKRRVRLEASERLAATQLKGAEINLERTEIRAPIDGVIVNEDSDLNTFVARGTLLVTIEDTSKVEVATSLRMDQLYWVLNQGGSSTTEPSRGYDLPETPAVIEYEMSGREGITYRWQGRLLSYDGIGVDPVTRTVPVRVVVDSPTEYIDQQGRIRRMEGGTALVRGMYVGVSLLIEPKADLVAIPARALQPGNRVFQFVRDESVLQFTAEPEASEAVAKNSPKPVPDQASGGVAAELSSFDPDRWDPGRVLVRQGIHPIDSLSIGDAANGSAENRVWVCEVPDQTLPSGSYVVVSPIADVDATGMPARAEIVRGSEDALAPQTQPAATESTVSKDDQSAEEA